MDLMRYQSNLLSRPHISIIVKTEPYLVIARYNDEDLCRLIVIDRDQVRVIYTHGIRLLETQKDYDKIPAILKDLNQRFFKGDSYLSIGDEGETDWMEVETFSDEVI